MGEKCPWKKKDNRKGDRVTEGNVQFKKCKTCDFVFKKKGKRRKKKERRQGGVSRLQIKTTFGNLLKEAYLHLYEGWVGREKKIRILLHPLNCQISLETSHS